jgi:polygalacturonase
MLFNTAFCFVALSLPLHAKTIDYKKAWTAKGDKIPNFSFAGYHESEVALPALSTSAKKTLSPGSGDQSAAIQAALDKVFQDGGGVVALKAGTYSLSSSLLIQNGTTLRGAGIGKTILTVKDLSDNVVTLGKSSGKEKKRKSIEITDDYVPAGTGTVHVADASGLSVGMNVYVERGVTQKWINKMGMTAHTKEEGFPRDFTWLKVTHFALQHYVYNDADE